MKYLVTTIGFAILWANPALAREQLLLARITGYWRNEGSGQNAAWTGARLKPGHCAVDPKKIPYGSKVIFPDTECVAVDTGPAVVSRKSARACGRNATERSAIVVDRFFETRRDAVAWTNAHPQFMTLRIVTPDTQTKHRIAGAAAKSISSHRAGALTLAPLNSFQNTIEPDPARPLLAPKTSLSRREKPRT